MESIILMAKIFRGSNIPRGQIPWGSNFLGAKYPGGQTSRGVKHPRGQTSRGVKHPEGQSSSGAKCAGIKCARGLNMGGQMSGNQMFRGSNEWQPWVFVVPYGEKGHIWQTSPYPLKPFMNLLCVFFWRNLCSCQDISKVLCTFVCYHRRFFETLFQANVLIYHYFPMLFYYFSDLRQLWMECCD